MHESDTRTDCGLKLFFIDVGQGDACLIESPNKRILIDGGPSDNVKRYFTKWKYKWLFLAGFKVSFDAIIVTHFDADHFAGINHILSDPRFKVKALYHNGIARFHDKKKERLSKYDTDLGQSNKYTDPHTERDILKTSFSTITDAKKLLNESPGKKGLMWTFKRFLEAAVKAKDEGRLGKMRRLTARDEFVPGFGPASELELNVLGPIPTSNSGPYRYKWFEDSSHTRNGHSVVIRLEFQNRCILLGGDLNSESERYLQKYYSPNNPFRVDAAKACHHGASEFTVDFMKAIKPYATVFSSGDNENYSHPRADAIGCAGRYSRGNRPLVFSTELARSMQSPDRIHYGLINLRSDGDQMMLAQMLEKKKKSDLWDSYILP